MVKILSKLLLFTALTLNVYSWGIQSPVDTPKTKDSASFDVDGVFVIRNKPFFIIKTIAKEEPILVLKSLPWAIRNCVKIYKISETTDLHGVMDWIVQQRPELNKIKDRIVKLACTGTPITGTIELLKDLYYQGYPIVIATNQGRKTFDILVNQGILPNIPYKLIFTSDYFGKEKILKKPKAIYFEKFKKELAGKGLSYKNTIFIDDKKENVESAQKADIESIQFKNPAQLKKDLEARGIHFSNQENISLESNAVKA